MAASMTFTRIPELMNILKFPGTLKLTNIQLKTLLIKFQSKKKGNGVAVTICVYFPFLTTEYMEFHGEKR